nr:hypothetical protein [Acidobacteriota bacterium]
MSTRTIRIFAVAIALYAACTAFGQKTPGHELGVRPNRLYEFDNIDTINLLNGNLMIAVPIGAAAPVGPQLGLQLKLVYNSKVWDYEVIFDPNQATPDITGHPNHRSNAGLGWRLSLGQLLPPNDSTLEYENRLTWVYEGPSGDENLFHRNFPGEASTAGTDAVMFSPAARLRLRTISPIEREVDFPSGEIHTFIKAASGQWLLVKQRDRFGNSIDIYHRYDSSGKESYWEITDSKHEPNSKTVIVHFQDVDESSLSDTTWRGRIVESVEVRTFGTTTKAKYEFKYTYIAVPPACGDTETGSGPARTTTLPFLTSVKQPDGTSYTFDYHRTVTECEQGALKQMNLPSGGALGYTYRTYQIQFDRCSTAPWYNQPVGIATKTASDDSTIDANDKAQWTYVPSAGAQLDLYHPPDRRFDQQCGTEMETTEDPSWVNKLPIEPRRWIRTTVLSPAVATDATGILRRRRTDHYFDAWPTVGETRGDPNFQHDLAREFGSPGVVAAPSVTDNATGIFPRDAEGPDVAAADADGRLLLRRVFADCADSVTGVCTSVAPGSGRLIRSEYGQSAYAAQYLGPDRDLSSRTVFEDDTSCGGVCSVTTTNTDWNTAGQNRTTTVVSTILGTPTRESTTQYPDWTAPQLRDLLTPWIFTTYASSTQKETAADGTVSEATETTCFSATGFLERKRISRSGGNDILAVYEDADAAGTTDGYVSAEKYYGGDDPAASAVPASFNTCSGNVTTFSPRYVLRHEYSYGVRSRTRYDGATFNVLDRTVDPTGLVSISRDANGRKTFFTYDVMGRLRRLLPPAAAWTKLDYDLTVTPRKVTVAQYAADDPDATIPLTEMRAYYDGMGRLLQDRKRLPGVDAWSVSTHQYDVMGRKIFASVPVKS